MINNHQKSAAKKVLNHSFPNNKLWHPSCPGNQCRGTTTHSFALISPRFMDQCQVSIIILMGFVVYRFLGTKEGRHVTCESFSQRFVVQWLPISSPSPKLGTKRFKMISFMGFYCFAREETPKAHLRWKSIVNQWKLYVGVNSSKKNFTQKRRLFLWPHSCSFIVYYVGKGVLLKSV